MSDPPDTSPSQPPPPTTEPLGGPPPPSASPQRTFRQASWGPAQALLGILCVLGLLIAGGLLIYPITGADGIDATLASQALLEIALVATAYGIARRSGERSPFEALGLRRPRPGWMKTAAAGYGIYFLAVIAIIAVFGDPEQSDVADQLGFDESVITAIVAAALIVFIVPVCEELFFRGFFFAGMRSKLPFWAAALISALLFGAVHLGDANLVAALQLTTLGLVLAAVYERTDSLWSNIAIHAFNNAIAFTLLVAT
ncbi:MAG TPA: CPBP family intramembrane glutamic endopeptidase [Solirubrobacterales bacterium]